MEHFTVSQDNHHAYQRWGFDQPVTDEMRGLMNTVAIAEAAGVFYTKDMYAYVCACYDFTEEELARGKGVEGGTVGMDIYYARGRLRHEKEVAEDETARATLNLEPGTKLGCLLFNYARGVMRNCSVASITPTHVRVLGTRGNQRFNVDTTARAIVHAKDRYLKREALKRA